MMRRGLVLIVCLILGSMASCGKPAAPVPDEPASCSIVSTPEALLSEGTELRIWNLRTFRLTQLTASLFVITDGNIQTATEVVYRWAPGTGTTTGPLTLLVQDGKPFGMKGRLPSLSLDFQGTASISNSRKDWTPQMLVGADVHFETTMCIKGPSRVSERSVLYARAFAQKPSSVASLSLVKGIESLVESSQGGRTILAVSLEWFAP